MTKKLLNLLVIISMLVIAVPTVLAAPPAQDGGEDYSVVADDWLSKLADKYLGSVLAYPAIVEFTNQKAAEDSSYTAITNPDFIEIGWKIYIPSAEEAAAYLETAPAVTAPLADAQSRTADPNNHFPNGIGEVDCAGVNLAVATQVGPQIASPVQDFWKEWGDKTGGTVEVQEFPFGDLFEKIRTGFVSGASPFDIIIYASDWAGDIMGAGYVLEVPETVQDQVGYGYLIPTYRDRILAWGGKVWALPYDGDAHNVYYRRDLLTDPDFNAEFQAEYGYDIPVPIQTWDQYVDIAQFFNGKEVDGQTVYGAGTAFKRKAQSYWTFLGVAASYSKAPGDPAYFFDAVTMEPRINNPGFVEALNTYVALSKAGPPDVVNWDVGDIRGNFPAGTLALAIDWGDVGPLAADPTASIVGGKWGSMVHPGVDRYWDTAAGAWVDEYNQAPFHAFGGWVLSVAATTERPECAFDFGAFISNQNISQLLVTYPGSGVNPHFFSDLNNLDPWLAIGMTAGEAEEYVGVIRTTIGHPNAVIDLRITGAAEYFDALDTQLARAVAGEVDAQTALDEVAVQWNAITDRLGRDQQLEQYRAMMGLPPL
jgi:multiple sugar transport system substrate-binding protein